jgi:hypothetical protein
MFQSLNLIFEGLQKRWGIGVRGSGQETPWTFSFFNYNWATEFVSFVYISNAQLNYICILIQLRKWLHVYLVKSKATTQLLQTVRSWIRTPPRNFNFHIHEKKYWFT